MSDEETAGDLRELVYLNDNSVNGYLSSLGEGLEVERGESEDTTDETRDRIFGGFALPHFVGGGETEDATVSSEGLQKQIEITMPYRLQTLREVIRESGREIKNPADAETKLNGGDIVEVEGIVEPLSFFRFELAQGTILTINEAIEELNSTAQEINEDDASDTEVEMEADESGDVRANEALVRVSEILNNERVPIKIDNDEVGTYGALLDRDQLLVPKSHAFSHPRKYRLFGRIDYIVPMNSKWEPTDTLRLARNYTTIGSELDEISDQLIDIAKQHDLKVDEEHMAIEGPTKVIHPIAMYW